MKRNQDRVLKNGSPSGTAQQPQTPNPAHDPYQSAKRAILDYEEVIYETIALIDLFRATFIPISESPPKSRFGIMQDATSTGCIQLAEGIKARLYDGYQGIFDAMPPFHKATAEQGRATP